MSRDHDPAGKKPSATAMTPECQQAARGLQGVIKLLVNDQNRDPAAGKPLIMNAAHREDLFAAAIALSQILKSHLETAQLMEKLGSSSADKQK